jgi:hypothetical protein
MFRSERSKFGQPTGLQVTTDLQVAFAHAATTVHNASATFANNIGSDFTIVLDETITTSLSGAVGQASFDFVLEVANNFTYDPSRGDLLLQIIVRDSDSTVSLDSSFNPEQFVTTRVYSTDLNQPRGTVGFALTNQRTYGLVTQFAFVPEPSAFALLGVALLSLSANRPGRPMVRHGQ